jgi:hypothetical protein
LGPKLKGAVIFGFIVLSCMSCGRKLPPLPPGQPDPVEIISLRFDQDMVRAKARCNVQDGTIILLGKPKGICPSCIDDLQKKDELFIHEPGVVVLKDQNPNADYMVYRVAFEKGTTSWMTQAGIVRK